MCVPRGNLLENHLWLCMYPYRNVVVVDIEDISIIKRIKVYALELTVSV